MKFKIDENLPIEIADVLNKNGHDAVTIIQENLAGALDRDILEICQIEKRALVTLDTDFADIRTYPPEGLSGLIVMRLGKQDKSHVLSIFNKVIRIFSEEHPDGHLWIVEDDRIRISAKEKIDS